MEYMLGEFFPPGKVIDIVSTDLIRLIVEASEPCRRQTTSLTTGFSIYSLMDISGAIFLTCFLLKPVLIFYKLWTISTDYMYCILAISLENQKLTQGRVGNLHL